MDPIPFQLIRHFARPMRSTGLRQRSSSTIMTLMPANPVRFVAITPRWPGPPLPRLDVELLTAQLSQVGLVRVTLLYNTATMLLQATTVIARISLPAPDPRQLDPLILHQLAPLTPPQLVHPVMPLLDLPVPLPWPSQAPLSPLRLLA
jgi:hypothetical protein